MISVINTYSQKFRTFGWVQDASNWYSLCDVVSVFDEDSRKHNELKNNIIPKLVEEQDGRDDLIKALNRKPLKIKYAELIGTAFKPRKISRCNGIIQATVKGQKRNFIGDWPADNYIRWAYCLGFIKYNYSDDTFEITSKGRDLTKKIKEYFIVKSNIDNHTDRIFDKKYIKLSYKKDEIKDLLINAVLTYPPAIRILKLLSKTEDTHLTKFEIGRQLGFIGEDGFTSLSQKTFIRALINAEPKERKSMKADWEGSSDKYARTIASWLEKLGLIEKVQKEVKIIISGKKYSEKIGQAYIITAQGILVLGKAEGKSSHKKIAKNVHWEMLCTKGSCREYVRTRRAFILKYISERKGVSVQQIKDYLKTVNMNEKESTIYDDIKGLQNMGINIIPDPYLEQGHFLFKDKINDFIIPLPGTLVKSELEEIKEITREKMIKLPHSYLSLIDLAYDSKQNRLFEIKVLELLTEECNYQGLHLGGSRKPDGIIYTNEARYKYGVIIDTKAYSKGYNLPIAQADEMERYIGENQTRSEIINPNKWWENFGNDINEFFFMFISGHFTGNFKSQIERISKNKGINGTALAVTNLLLCAESYKNGEFTHEKIKNEMFKNDEFIYN